MKNYVSRITVLICSLFLLAIIQISAKEISNSLSNNRINDITQDDAGHIWIGTFRGLNKFDSHEYHQYFCNETTGLPDNQITSLFKDSHGRLWVGTVNGVCQYMENDKFKQVPIYGTFSQNASKIMESSCGKILLNTIDAICVYNEKTDCFENRIPVLTNETSPISASFITADNKLWIITDKVTSYDIATFRPTSITPLPINYAASSILAQDGNIWISSNQGIVIFDTKSNKLITTPKSISNDKRFSQAYITQMFKCGNYLLFFSDTKGTFAYNFKTGIVQHQEDPNFPFNIPDFKLNSVYTDSFNNIWWCSYDQGYQISYAYKERFGNNLINNTLKGKSVTALDYSPNGILYIATLRDGIYSYNIKDNSISKLIGKEKNNKKDVAVNSLIAYKDGTILIGTYSSIIRYKITGNQLEPIRTWNFPYVLSMKQDKSGNIWVGTAGTKLTRIDKYGQVQTIDLNIPENTYTFISGIEILPSGNILAVTFSYGMYEIDYNTLSAKKIAITQEDWNNCIKRSVFIPSAIKADSYGNIWIGTVANGLLKYDYITNHLEPIPGTPCDDICSIEEDMYGNLWVSTQYGLAKYDRTIGHFINWFASDGIGGNQFYDRASCITKDGLITLGGTHGITLFDPVYVMTNRNIPLMFETLKIHNNIVTPEENGNISKALSFDPEINLKYNQNSFSIGFTALDFSEFDRVRYSYMLEGFDKYWIDANNNREATYANIPHGKYKFKVRITNIDQTEILAEKQLNLTIQRPAYLSWWAYLLYMVIITGVAAIIIIYRKRLLAEKMAKKQAAMEREQEKKVNEMNMSFFANISHEFRTPLTMISAPIAQLSESESVDAEGKRLLDIVRRNIQRMLRLVNQLLDFNKMENDTLKLKVTKKDIIPLLTYLSEIFRVTAKDKGITFISWGIEDSLQTWIDEDKVDKICFNLLSNAMKFTPAGGKVEISLDYITKEDAAKYMSKDQMSNSSRYIKITVKDNGPGIPESELEKIFERYYQVDNNSKGSYNWGTGIGLYYARALAQMHHGVLKASNRTDVQGAMFTLLLPSDETAYSVEEKGNNTETDIISRHSVKYSEIPSNNTNGNKHTVLVVDDDSDVIRYMKELLSQHYNVICRYSADAAYMVLKEEAPDIIVSDVVMPGKSGYDLCRDIKGSIQLSHIPVILLTAKANVDDQVEGLDCGADAYVTKPFEPQYLIALINSMIKNREKIRKMLSTATEVTDFDKDALSEQDNIFMKDLYELMEKEISNAELDVTGMTERLHISRTKFYYKVKGLTGENPSVFFKTYKLNRAAQLLKDRKYNISEIADMTGFSTLSHFSTSFKKQFGVSPSEYIKH